MAYFPNGTAGLMYQERYCFRCRNYRDKGNGPGCGIWDAHIVFAYDSAGESEKAKALRELLGMLIPEDGIRADECSMFLDDGKDHDTLPLPGVE